MRNILFGLLFLTGFYLQAQPLEGQRFAAYGFAGLSAAQIDGDYYFGYNKVGLTAGAGAHILLKPKFYLSVGLQFTQTGASPGRREKYSRGGATLDVRLNGIEIPVMLNYRLGKKDEYTRSSGYRLFRSTELQFGLSVYRLFKTAISRTGRVNMLPRQEDFVSVLDHYNSTDLYFLFGVAQPINRYISVYLRHSKSVLGLYRPDRVVDNAVLPLFPYHLTLGVRAVLY